MTTNQSPRSWLPLLLLLSFTGMALLTFVTKPWGMGISPDSVDYLTAARHFLEGHGLSVLSEEGARVAMMMWPPLFPVVISGVGFFGLDLFQAARILNILLFGGNILLVGFLLKRFTGSLWIAAAGASLTLSSLCMLKIHSMVWSEPLFLFLSLLTFYGLFLYGEKPQFRFLLFSATSAALAFLTRYAAFALVTTGTLAVFLWGRKKVPHKIRDGVVFAAISWFPVSWWLIRNTLYANEGKTAVGLRIQPHPVSLDYLRHALHTVATWFVPENSSGGIKIAVLSIAGVAMIFALRVVGQRFNAFFRMVFLFAFFYGLMLVCYIAFLGYRISLDNRILSPVFVVLVLFSLLLVHALWGLFEGRNKARVILVSIIAMLGISYFYRGLAWARTVYHEGQEFSGKAWKESLLLQRVKAMPHEVPVYTNASDAIYILTGRITLSLPKKKRKREASLTNARWVQVREALEKRGAVLAYFNRITWRDYYPTENDFQEILPLRRVAVFPEGAMYRLKETR